MRYLIVLLAFTCFFLSNSIADDNFNSKKIQEFIHDGYLMTYITHYENGDYHAILEKKPIYKVVEGQIIEMAQTSVLVCKFNLKETVCIHP